MGAVRFGNCPQQYRPTFINWQVVKGSIALVSGRARQCGKLAGIRPGSGRFSDLAEEGGVTFPNKSRALAVSFILLLSGCGPQVIGVVKTADYEQRITGARVIVLATQVSKSDAMAAKSGKALATFNDVATKRLPDLASRDGLDPVVIKVGDPDFTKGGYKKLFEPGKAPRQFLIVNPYRYQTRCSATCRTTLTVITSVYDTRLEKEVWQASVEVSEKSGLHQFDAGDIDSYWAMVIDQLKQGRLL